MTPKQAQKLLKLRNHMLALPGEAIKMDRVGNNESGCAYPRVEALFDIDTNSDDEMRRLLGIDLEEEWYIFSIGGANHYLPPHGHAAAEEFAERVENILQFHGF